MTFNPMKIFAFSGLGVDERVFENLEIEDELVFFPWLNYSPKMGLLEFVKQYKTLLPKDEKFGILGLSFGGLMAVELSKISNPEFTILISTAETYKEIPLVYRFIGWLKIQNFFPSRFFVPPMLLANYMFSPINGVLLQQILADSSPDFNKWAVNQLLGWRNMDRLSRVFKIHGTKDRMIPAPNNSETILLNGGSHFMVHNDAQELSRIINNFLLDTKLP